MPLLNPPLDQTDLDQEALEARAFNLIRTTFPDWTERKVANFGNLLVALFCSMGDRLYFYQDNQAGEAFWKLATQRRSLLALAKQIGYKAPGAAAGSTSVTISIPAPLAGDVVLPKGTVIPTSEVTSPVNFQLLADATIPAGQTSVSATVENSAFQSDTFQADGTPNQSFLLKQTPYLDGSAAPVAANGAYTEVEDLLDSTSTDRHFVVTVDQNDRAKIDFGNGVNGAAPTGSIVVTYKTGGGLQGVIEPNSLKRVEGTFTDTFGTPARLTVSQPNASTGAAPRASLAVIKRNGPRSLTVQKRAVSRPDFEVVAENIPGVARALHLTSNEQINLGENRGIMFLVPTGGGAPSQLLKDTVKAQFAESGPFPSTTTYLLQVQGALYQTVDVYSTVYVVVAGSQTRAQARAAARANVVAALKSFFSVFVTDANGEQVPNPQIDFGYYLQGELAWSDIENAVRDASGIAKVDPGPSGLLLNGLRQDVPIALQGFPILGNVVLIDGLDGTQF